MDGHQDVARDLERRGLLGESAHGPEQDTRADRPANTSAGGRGRARVGGQLVPVATLAEVFGDQLEISSQHGSQALRHAETHVLALDAYADKTSLREIVAREVARVGRARPRA